jgi:hypothetical protein
VTSGVETGTPRSMEDAGVETGASLAGSAAVPELTVEVLGIGLLGPGLPDWATGQALLRDPARWSSAATVVPPPARLPPTERRRAGAVVKASLVAADEAVAMSGLDPAALPTVFTSSTGDPVNCHLLCEALAAPERLVSPTRFTNSVHNAAAGYWHIAVAGRAPSTSLAAFDASFAAGLLEALVQATADDRPVLLVAADVPYPEPLHAKRPLPDTMAVALVLAPCREGRVAPGGQGSGPGGAEVSRAGSPAVPQPGPRRLLRLRLCGFGAADDAPTRCAGEGLEALRQAIPAARALPLLQALAGELGGGAADAGCLLEGLPGQPLRISVTLDDVGPTGAEPSQRASE